MLDSGHKNLPNHENSNNNNIISSTEISDTVPVSKGLKHDPIPAPAVPEVTVRQQFLLDILLHLLILSYCFRPST